MQAPSDDVPRRASQLVFRCGGGTQVPSGDDGDEDPRQQPSTVAADDDDDDDDLISSEDDDDPRVGAKKARTDVKKPGSKPRHQNDDGGFDRIDYGYDESKPVFVGDEDGSAAFILNLEQGSKPWLKPTPWRERKRTQDFVREHRCTFWNESNCRFKIKELRKLMVRHLASPPPASPPHRRVACVRCVRCVRCLRCVRCANHRRQRPCTYRVTVGQ